MKLLIIQPKLEQSIEQLECALKNNSPVDAVIFPEGYLNENVEQACTLAREHNTVLIGGYRRFDESPKDRAIVINHDGEVVLDRAKYTPTAFVTINGLKVGHILCDELIVQGLKTDDTDRIDLVVHPIGVGMFSDEQFDEWITKATSIAAEYKTTIVGTSHADGSYRNSGTSIPIAYCIGAHGNQIYVAKNNVHSFVFDTVDKSVSHAECYIH